LSIVHFVSWANRPERVPSRTGFGRPARFPEIIMSGLTNALFWPFTAVLRLAYAHPWPSILLSSALAGAALALHHVVWVCAFLGFGSYILMWLDESQNPLPVQMGSDDNIA
jgi:hypothetical protein